ncbi:sensor histidine kinase [Anaeromyxobacter sp. PSR-1]|uniref:sensor histidine kinase n=1 Tax=Anaeromyxobacter sp. PSR-1 TaxID=1300915 RepID=UPI0005EA54E4|nr:ATP-binding protein [Anaeromyxobacter sp. PSR-1]GAO01471.1 sensor protein ZraS [Anaeromyxobacter sp. PSR-1]
MSTWRTARGALRLWTKLAAFAVLGVVSMHAVHLVVGNRVAIRALERDQAQLGGGVARLVAGEIADPILLHDNVTLAEIVTRAASIPGVAYCFVVRDGAVLASSFRGSTPAALVEARGAGFSGPLVVLDGASRFLDLEEPVLGGKAGRVRLGIDMALLLSARRQIAFPLGLVALAVILAGVVAAVVVARSVVRPIDELVAVADGFDPTTDPRPVRPRGGPELERLAERFNGMMLRLRSAFEEQERAKQKAIVTERLAALGSLVAGVAHEVNNPLAGLKNCVHALRLGDTDAATRAEYLDLMDEGLDRIRDVVRRLLEFGRPRPLDPILVEPRRLADDVSRFVASVLRGRRIVLETTSDPALDGAAVSADPRQIGQALLNLVLNAAYVTPDGGRISLRLRRRPAWVGIAVVDAGPGIAEGIRDRILDPFFSTKPEGEGTGLGLSVTRAIVDSHHGELEFECPTEGGTIATIWLPEAKSDRRRQAT